MVALYPQVLKEVFKGVDSSDVNISIVSMETVAFIAHSPPGKAALYKQDEQVMRHIMGKLQEAITKFPTEWRVRALAALADIIHLNVDHITSDITKVSLAWFNQLGPSALQNIFEMARQPFPDIKAAAFNVLEKIAAHRWGQIKIINHPGLFEFLLDRSTETTLEGKQAKYDVIKTLYNSPTISSTFPDEHCDRMAKYLQEGVIYVPIGNHVAVEGAD
uniref:26S proteasome non-ATPase regulatory subunit 5 n=1 Tax=Triatoma infestans TaxID=30076 RepID=A0A171BAZ8_TRIIF